MFERFTDRARRVLVLAQEEARLLEHNFIGTEHILAGLVHEGDGLAAKTLEALGVSLEVVREQVLGLGEAPPGARTGSPPFTPRAKKALEHGLREALRLGHNYIGTEHLLLGIIDDPDDPTVAVLARLGHDPERIRAKVLEILQTGTGPAGAPVVAPTPGTADPACPSCGAQLAQCGAWSRLELPSSAEPRQLRPVIVVHCRVCGRAVGILADGG